MIDRIVPIAGDISKPGLGISKEDEEILVGSVSIVFHLAATIQSLRDPFIHLYIYERNGKTML